jgi:cellulose 1,4-beta-cellobiosidase
LQPRWSPDTTLPTIPVLSGGAITTTSSIPLTWTASTDNVGVAGYRLIRYTPAYTTGHSGRGGGITYHPATYSLLVDGISPATTSYPLMGLSPNSTYNYAVADYDAAGNKSGYSIAGGKTLQTPSIT